MKRTNLNRAKEIEEQLTEVEELINDHKIVKARVRAIINQTGGHEYRPAGPMVEDLMDKITEDSDQDYINGLNKIKVTLENEMAEL